MRESAWMGVFRRRLRRRDQNTRRSFTSNQLNWYPRILMRTVDLIHRKRDGEELSTEEIAFMVDGYNTGAIPDYQASAFLMAIFFSGMTDREVSALTERMVGSGEVLDLS